MSAQGSCAIAAALCLQEKEDPTEEDLDAEIAAAKMAALSTKSGRTLGRSFGFRSKKDLLPAAVAGDADKKEETDAGGAAAKASQ